MEGEVRLDGRIERASPVSYVVRVRRKLSRGSPGIGLVPVVDVGRDEPAPGRATAQQEDELADIGLAGLARKASDDIANVFRHSVVERPQRQVPPRILVGA